MKPTTWWSTNRAAEFLGVHPETLRRWTRQGRVPARRLGSNGGRYRYNPAALQSLLTHRWDTNQNAPHAAISETTTSHTSPWEGTRL